MFMRYHWGLGVGHTYTHGHKGSDADTTADPGDLEDLEEEEEHPDQRCGTSNSDGEVSDSDSGTDSEESYDSDEYDTLDYEN